MDLSLLADTKCFESIRWSSVLISGWSDGAPDLLLTRSSITAPASFSFCIRSRENKVACILRFDLRWEFGEREG